MKKGKKIFISTIFLLIPGILGLFLLERYDYIDWGGKSSVSIPSPALNKIVKGWSVLSGNRRGKLVYARPPKMYILDLSTGHEKEVPNVVVAGAPGRRQRGNTPRPFWSPDGGHFVYRYNNNIYICDEGGNKRIINNEKMNCGKETRWSWFRQDNTDWIVGPSLHKNVIMVNISDPSTVIVAYSGGDVKWHCELTGTDRYVVYDDGSDIYVTTYGSSEKGIRISDGQSCRPCASPDDRVAWLPAPHVKYQIYKGSDGKYLGDLTAPEDEEIYRLNWSNKADFAVHMYGSRGNTKINIRKVSTGEYLFVGNGWDPDLWIGEPLVKD